MTYTVEGVAYATEQLALDAARELHDSTGRTIQVHTGDSTQGAHTVQTIGAPEAVAANEDLEPVDRTERLAKRNTAQPNTDPVSLIEE
jgi:hypothetical protein